MNANIQIRMCAFVARSSHTHICGLARLLRYAQHFGQA